MDYGTAVSQKGYDVKTCADRFLVYSSKFQTLKIYATYSVSTTIPTTGNTSTININHNLGYFSPFMVIYNGNSSIGTANSYFFSDITYSPISTVGPRGTANNTINTLTITLQSNWDGGTYAGETAYFTVYLFLNDFSTISHSEANTGTSTGATSTDYGIRVSKDGYDVKTTDDINCVFSSSFFNNIIDQQGIHTALGGSPEAIPISSLGYIPQCLAFIQPDGEDFIEFIVGYATFSFGIDLNNLYVFTTAGHKIYYIIFKGQLDG